MAAVVRRYSTSVRIASCRPGRSSRPRFHISAGLDQSTRVASDGTWSLEVTLKSGINALRFRVEDEKATTRTLRLVYTP